jgi:hypothetical protein
MLNGEAVGPHRKTGRRADMSPAEDNFAGHMCAIQLQRATENAAFDEQVAVDLCPSGIEPRRPASGQADRPGTSACQLGPFLQPAIQKFERESNLPVGESKATSNPCTREADRRDSARPRLLGTKEQTSDYIRRDRSLRSPASGLGRIVLLRLTRTQVHHSSLREAAAQSALGRGQVANAHTDLERRQAIQEQ